tara:strand:- start:9118 stop:9522 length:405 start_codon:yes stop_codon:yes gene_type:complete
MKLVVDTNRIIAALIKNGISRKILFNKDFVFVTPDYSIIETRKYADLIKKKAKITSEEFEILLSILFERIETIPKLEYEKFLEKCKPLISDVADVPFLAVASALKTDGIWSDDAHFEEQNNIKVYKTKDMVKLI